jgi:hypothetical protein
MKKPQKIFPPSSEDVLYSPNYLIIVSNWKCLIIKTFAVERCSNTRLLVLVINTFYVLFLQFDPLKPKLVLIIFNRSVLTSKKTQPITITEIVCLMLFKEIIAAYKENNMKAVKGLCRHNAELLMVKASGNLWYKLPFGFKGLISCFIIIIVGS